MRAPTLTRASTVATTKAKFLFDPIIPQNTLTLFAARAGVGKSTLTLKVIADATKGILEGDRYGQRLNVLVLAPEDSRSMQTLRLKGAGADLDRVFFLGLQETSEDGYISETAVKLPRDVDLLIHTIARHQIGLVVIDPITSLVSGRTDSRDEIRAALDPLMARLHDLNTSVVGVLHFKKGGGAAGDMVSGSLAWRDIARSLLLMVLDPETGIRICTLEKSSYSPHAGKSWQFALESINVTTDDGDIQEVARIAGWTESDRDVQEVIDSTAWQPGDSAGSRSEALEFIIGYLVENNGEAIAGEAIKAGRLAGFTENEIKNARKRSKTPRILSQKSSFGAGWVWTFAHEGVTETSQGVQEVTQIARTPSTPSSEEVTPSEPVCPVCLEPMIPIPGFNAHPTCTTND